MPVVVLDPGHGGSAKIGGSSPNNATGPSGTLEKTLTLDVASRMARLLSGHASVQLTRQSDTNLSLADRADVARRAGADMFLSIHFNGFRDSTVDGSEVWVARNANRSSNDFAQSVLSHLVGATNARNRGVRQSNLGVLLPARHAPGTAATLAEIAFLTNPDEERRLADESYRDQIAQALAAAIVERSASAPAQSLGISDFLMQRLVRYFSNESAQGIPLDPGEGGRSIDASALQMGDIIVSTTSHASSRGIRFGTGSLVSHAKLYIGGSQIVEAVGDGVVLRSLEQSLDDDTLAVAFRYPGITDEQALRVRDFVGRQLDRPYNYIGIVRQALFQIESSRCDVLPGDLQQTCRSWVGKIVLGPGNTDTFFCSQLVLAAYADAGIPLTATNPSWSTPQDIVELQLATHLAYVGHLKAPPASSSQSFSTNGHASSALLMEDTDRRRMSMAIGGYGAAPLRTLDTVTLGWGVPGGVITDGFYRDQQEKFAVTGQRAGRARHLGIDVSRSNAHGGGADDPRRGLPVYAAVRPSINVADLNAVRVMDNDQSQTGLGLNGQGTAQLQNAVVLRQPWGTRDDSAYGGVVGLACRYQYSPADSTPTTFTLYIEFLHLITADYLPKDGQGNIISASDWATTGKGIGFGPRIVNNAVLSAVDLTASDPILVGYLGATQFPHVHIQASFGMGQQGYLRRPRVDPAVMLLDSTTTTQSQALDLPTLSLNNMSFSYDVPGTVPAIAQPTPNTCWATAATMLMNWRLNQPVPRSIEDVCAMAGPQYRAKFANDQGLLRAEKQQFLDQMGFAEEPPGNYQVQGLLDLLRNYGPLWVTTDSSSTTVVLTHARVMTGMYGDGGVDDTFVMLIDPSDGQRHQQSFRQFMLSFEQVAKDVAPNEPLWIQVVHNRARSVSS
jgi:N-acetylmuramoyl-L-alanine amidase/uncharacterized protein YycO